MRVLVVVDKIPSAIWVCARAMKYVDGFINYKIVAVHPKRPNEKQLADFEKYGKEADIIDFQYWKTADMLLKSYKWLRDKPKILTHHNPYDVDRRDWWEDYDMVVVKNDTQRKKMYEVFNKQPEIVRHTTNTDFFQFQRKYPSHDVFKVLMVAARIEGKKGIKEVAMACKATKTQMILVGRISSMDYLRETMFEGSNYVDFRQDVTDEKLKEAYYEANLLVNNSKDGFESGTLPHLEAMACGVPVLTRNVGLVPDFYNGKNMIVREGEQSDWKEIAKYIKELKEDRDKCKQLRYEGYKSMLARDDRYTGRKYYKLYRKVLFGEKPLVSVIVPTCNRNKALVGVLSSINLQDYENVEVVVVDDSKDGGAKEIVKEFKEVSSLSVKYVNQKKMGYGLARARNRGVVESNGEVLMFIDDRFFLERDVVSKFVKRLKPNVWLFGNKGGADKEAFVENFSCVHRKTFVKTGMFNEQMVYYGGITRDMINRMAVSQIVYEYLPDVKCKVLVSSKSRYKKMNELMKSRFIMNQLWG